MKKLDLVGKKFEKLTVISKANNILPSEAGGRSFTGWNCRCECGKILIVRTGTLTSNAQKSCGCTINLSLYSGQKINRLTMINYIGNSRWLCECECGKTLIANTGKINSGNTKSCGCLKKEALLKNRLLSPAVITKYEPNTTSARRLWKSYCRRDLTCNLTFDEWLLISQMNCNYCGIAPSNNYNCFIGRKSASQKAKNNGWFVYNGIDRVNNDCTYSKDNIVPCCWTCNRAKSNRSIIDFHKYIIGLKKINKFIFSDRLLTLPNSYLLVSVKCAYRHYKRNYGKMEIDLPTFYTYSKLPCFYCRVKEVNYYNVYLKDKKASKLAKDGAHYYYNGIDRLDNNKSHTKDNIVPCCKYCNFAKGNLLLEDFNNWIIRIKDHQKKCNV